MKRVIAILTLGFYLLSLTEFNELLKVPVLINHYTEHQEKNKSLSFFEFLSMHYSQADDNDGDKDKDMQLPFKSHVGCIGDITFAYTNNETSEYFTHHAVSENLFSEHISDFVNSNHQASIWQPPKSC